MLEQEFIIYCFTFLTTFVGFDMNILVMHFMQDYSVFVITTLSFEQSNYQIVGFYREQFWDLDENAICLHIDVDKLINYTPTKYSCILSNHYYKNGEHQEQLQLPDLQSTIFHSLKIQSTTNPILMVPLVSSYLI